ncbi:acetolactate synthase small subunit [Bradyrhizobium sp. GM2.4]
MNQPASAYFIEERHDPNETHTLSVLVQNEPGVLARVIGLFSGRGYNIESLTVSETESQKHLSRITIVTTGTPMVIEQIKHQLDRMIPVYRVVDMTLTKRSIERELAMVKVRGQGEHSRRGAAAGGRVPRPRDRCHHRELRVRDHRQYRQDQSVYRPDASAWPCRSVAHRCCRDWSRA